MFFDVLEPHSHHCVAVIFVKASVSSPERKREGLLLCFKELRKCFLFNGVNLFEGEPPGESWEGEMGWRLNDGGGH